MSLAMAISILRRFSACSSSWLVHCTRVSLVTPSTMSATVEPKSFLTRDLVLGVSSITSCSSAAITLSSSSPSSEKIISAVAMQCVTYGEPSRRFWLAWAAAAYS